MGPPAAGGRRSAGVTGLPQPRQGLAARCIATGAVAASIAAAEKLERVLTNDPGTGVMRHVDAGYDHAKDIARERGLQVPMGL